MAALVLLGALALWALLPGPSAAPILVVPAQVEPASSCFVQVVAPRFGLPGQADSFERTRAACLAAQPDFVIVMGECTGAPDQLPGFLAALRPFEAAGVPVFWLPGQGDVGFARDQLPTWASLRRIAYGPLRLHGLCSALLRAEVVAHDGAGELAQRLLARLRQELEQPGVHLLWHSSSALPGAGWDPALRAAWLQLRREAPALLSLGAEPAASLAYVLREDFEPWTGGPGKLELAGRQPGVPVAWRLFRLAADGRGIAFAEWAGDGTMLSSGELPVVP